MIKTNMVWMKKSEHKPGFTLVETLVSLLLVFLTLVIMTRITARAMEGYRRSRDGFQLLQEMESYKNRLQGKPFDASEWQEGYTLQTIIPFKIGLEVQSLGPDIKYARLSFTYINRYLHAHTEFYKSLYITNKSKNHR
jgi:hypothetical protein